MKVTVEVDNVEGVCEVCGGQYAKSRMAQKYCSRKCYKRAEYLRNKDRYKESSRQWYANNHDQAVARRREYYWKDPEKWREKSNDYRKANLEKVADINRSYKDVVRHGGKRQELIDESGLVCSECGKECNSFQIVAHHETFDPTRHDEQVLLCRSCHMKAHMDQIQAAR